MYRNAVTAMILAAFVGGITGCGASDPAPAEQRPGVEERKSMQKEKQGQSYMKPDEK
jgi:hypothetical protein